ncbi:MAG: tRNA (adenosine(37)-N6)-threonylcarbamoyltransferase complex dimerization subunit type 1 TsaB [Rhodobacteraceae bacterium]|nr:tRNA (adenosine(37)-N6)-threonylcarbamoyltransferase complex dimerization subunit type 1 TsaB [Paracoccaceae bacterium]TVR49610.1 MAG: tRNA (adenosine(37)-N6)-threonylcarbamoyltransferase complex dimerization subunit type 1 TsaB [Paracoccaceae bacterium]
MPSDPLILAFDTSAAHCAAALLRGDDVLAQRQEAMAKGQAERLMPLLEEVLAEGAADWRDLDALAVGVGPGNFTGVRIAVSAARGLALGLGCPAIGVAVFDARACGLPRPVCVVEEARRGQVYLQGFGAHPVAPVLQDAATLDLPRDLPLVGSAADAISARTGQPVRAACYPLAAGIARVARTRLGDAAYTRPAPLYLRGPDAAPPSDPPPVLLP